MEHDLFGPCFARRSGLREGGKPVSTLGSSPTDQVLGILCRIMRRRRSFLHDLYRELINSRHNARRGKPGIRAMSTTSKFVLPYEPHYTGHREGEKQSKKMQDWRRRAAQETAPSIVPEPAGEDQREDDKIK
jgi:hypothetical protein